MVARIDGEVVAFADRCPHRLAPLSIGTICGTTLQCAYHGWMFDASGAVVEIPSLGRRGQDPAAGLGDRRRWRRRAVRPGLDQSGAAGVRPAHVPGVGRPDVRQRPQRTARDPGQRRPARRQLPRRHPPAHGPRRDVRGRRRRLSAAERDRPRRMVGAHHVRGELQELRRPARRDRRAPARPAPTAVQGDRRADHRRRAPLSPDDRQDGELPVRLLADEQRRRPVCSS